MTHSVKDLSPEQKLIIVADIRNGYASNAVRQSRITFGISRNYCLRLGKKYNLGVGSPFRQNKKQRRRDRKVAGKIRSGVPKWEETNPEAAASLERIATTIIRLSHKKRS